MSPGKDFDEPSVLRARVAELEGELQRHKDRTRTCEARFRLLVESAPAMIWMSGPDGLCTYFNRAWLEFRGRSLDDETGSGWTDGIHPEDRGLCLETYLKCFSVRQPFRMQYRLQRAGGDYCWVEDSGVPSFDVDGGFLGYMGAAIDINDRKRGDIHSRPGGRPHGFRSDGAGAAGPGPDCRRKVHQGSRRKPGNQL